MARSAHYHAEPYATHAIVPTADMVLLFHHASGDTHLLAEPMPDILTLLGDSPDTVDGLTARLCQRLDMSPDDEARAVVTHRLAELGAVGLVWQD